MLDLNTQSNVDGSLVVTSNEESPPFASQMWYLDHQPDGSLLVVSGLHGRVLDCGRGYKGTNLKVWKRHGKQNQRWRMNGHYLESVLCPGYVMDIKDGATAPGKSLILWTKNNPPSANQHFTFAKVRAILACTVLIRNAHILQLLLVGLELLVVRAHS